MCRKGAWSLILRFCSAPKTHGHSYIVEVFITSDKLDRGCMVMDFGLLHQVKMFIDSFDHSYSLWTGEDAEFKQFIYVYNRRVAPGWFQGNRNPKREAAAACCLRHPIQWGKCHLRPI